MLQSNESIRLKVRRMKMGAPVKSFFGKVVLSDLGRKAMILGFLRGEAYRVIKHLRDKKVVLLTGGFFASNHLLKPDFTFRACALSCQKSDTGGVCGSEDPSILRSFAPHLSIQVLHWIKEWDPCVFNRPSRPAASFVAHAPVASYRGGFTPRGGRNSTGFQPGGRGGDRPDWKHMKETKFQGRGRGFGDSQNGGRGGGRGFGDTPQAPTVKKPSDGRPEQKVSCVSLIFGFHGFVKSFTIGQRRAMQESGT